MARDLPSVRALNARAVDVPLRRPLQTSGGRVESAPLVLLDLETADGAVGRSYVFCYTVRALVPVVRLLDELTEVIRGDPVAPLAIEEKLQGTFRLLGAPGLVGMAMAAIDMAAWDVLAKAADLPLARLLGGEPRPVAAYNSCGLGIVGAAEAAREAEELAAPGFTAIKLRLGYRELATDLEVLHAVRGALPGEVRLMVDYNQSLTVPEAERRIARLDEADLCWIEEPIRWDDYAGHGRIRAKARTPIQLGENCWGAHDMDKALAAGACDLFMADVMKIGGITGWLRAAALAEPRGLPLSSHLFPEVSAQLLAITPSRHWLEYVDWAEPVLAEPLAVRDGQATPSQAPGIGLAWDEAAVARYLV